MNQTISVSYETVNTQHWPSASDAEVRVRRRRRRRREQRITPTVSESQLRKRRSQPLTRLMYVLLYVAAGSVLYWVYQQFAG